MRRSSLMFLFTVFLPYFPTGLQAVDPRTNELNVDACFDAWRSPWGQAEAEARPTRSTSAAARGYRLTGGAGGNEDDGSGNGGDGGGDGGDGGGGGGGGVCTRAGGANWLWHLLVYIREVFVNLDHTAPSAKSSTTSSAASSATRLSMQPAAARTKAVKNQRWWAVFFDFVNPPTVTPDAGPPITVADRSAKSN